MSPIESPKITKANIKIKVATHRLSSAILKFLSQLFKSLENRFAQNVLKWKIWSFLNEQLSGDSANISKNARLTGNFIYALILNETL